MWGGASAQWAESHRGQLEGLACGSQQEDQDSALGLLEERTMTIFTRKMRKGIQGVVPDTCNPKQAGDQGQSGLHSEMIWRKWERKDNDTAAWRLTASTETQAPLPARRN